MHADGPDRDGDDERVKRRDWPSPRPVDSLIAPVMEGEVTAKTLQAMRALFVALNMLHVQPADRWWKPIVKVEDGFAACKAFLHALARVSDILGIRPQSRAYRTQFTKNYKALFPDHRRHYRVDVLEASQEGYSIIYVNGERYDFHPTVMERGANFREAWAKALDTLHAMQSVDLESSPFWRSELVPVLVELDSKWAAFEEEYILELIQIERKARRYVMDVIFLENQLLYLDGAVAALVSQGNANQTGHLHVWQQWQSCRRQYVKKVFRLNAVANYRRKGHSSLDLSVLEASENIIKTSETEPGHIVGAVENMAADCVSSFNKLRGHINELAQTPERVDPHLCNNHVLVGHLCRLEETWELAHKYIKDPDRLQDLLSIIDFIATIVSTEKVTYQWLGDTADASPRRQSLECECQHKSQHSARASNPSVFKPFPQSQLAKRLGAASAQHKLQPIDDWKRTTSDTSSVWSQPRSCEALEPLESRLINCDVVAFLALPRFVCLYYLLDPENRLHVFRPFLPSLFSEDAVQSERATEGETAGAPAPSSSCQLPPVGDAAREATTSSESHPGTRRESETQQAKSPRAGAVQPSVSPIQPPGRDSGAAGGFAQQATAVEAAWAAKTQTVGRGSSPPCLPTLRQSAAAHRSSTFPDLDTLSTSEGGSTVSASLSTSLQDIEPDAVWVDSDSHGRVAAKPATVRRGAANEQQQAGRSRGHDEGCLMPAPAGKSSMFPWSSDSEWYLHVPRLLGLPEPGGEARWCQLLLSKVPVALKRMVHTWLKAVLWLRAAGIERTPEPWLCLVTRLADTGAFEPLMQSLSGTKVAAFRDHVEALFQAVEGVSMSMQRSCAAEWNECLQVIINGVTHRLAVKQPADTPVEPPANNSSGAIAQNRRSFSSNVVVSLPGRRSR